MLWKPSSYFWSNKTTAALILLWSIGSIQAYVAETGGYKDPVAVRVTADDLVAMCQGKAGQILVLREGNFTCPPVVPPALKLPLSTPASVPSAPVVASIPSEPVMGVSTPLSLDTPLSPIPTIHVSPTWASNTNISWSIAWWSSVPIPGTFPIPADFWRPSDFDRVWDYKWHIWSTLGLTLLLGIASWRHNFRVRVPVTPTPPQPPSAPTPIPAQPPPPTWAEWRGDTLIHPFFWKIWIIDSLIGNNDLEWAKKMCEDTLEIETTKLGKIILLFKLAEITFRKRENHEEIMSKIQSEMKSIEWNYWLNIDESILCLERIRSTGKIAWLINIFLGVIITQLRKDRFANYISTPFDIPEEGLDIVGLLGKYVETPHSISEAVLTKLYTTLLTWILRISESTKSLEVDRAGAIAFVKRICLLYRMSQEDCIRRNTQLDQLDSATFAEIIWLMFEMEETDLVKSILDRIWDLNNPDLQGNIETMTMILLPAETP